MLAFFRNILPWLLLSLLLAVALTVQVNFSADSIRYADIASNIATGEGLSSFYLTLESPAIPNHILDWPPLYPILLAAGLKLGLNIEASARLILLISFPLSCLTIYFLGCKMVSEKMGLLCLILWLAMAPLLSIWSQVWSEPPFIIVVAAIILCYLSALDQGAVSLPWLFLSGLLVGIVVLLRYVGAAFLLALPMSLFIYLFRQTRTEHKWRHFLLGSTVFLLGFLLLSSPWFLQNYLQSGRLTGIARPVADRGVFENTITCLQTVFRDMGLPLVVSLLLLVSALSKSEDRQAVFKIKFSNMPLVVISGAWILSYSVLVIALASIYLIDPVITRYISPIYMPLLPIIVYLGYWAHSQQKREFNPSNLQLGLIYLCIMGICVLTWQKRLDSTDIISRNKAAFTPAVTWIKEKTPSDALFVGTNIWWINFTTRRRSLELGYAEKPAVIPPKVSEFLVRFKDDYSKAYLVFSQIELSGLYAIINKYQELGYNLKVDYLDANFVIYVANRL